MRTGTAFQLKTMRFVENVPGMSVDPLAQAEEPTERLSLDLSLGDMQFIERYAAYRNAMNDLQDRTIRQRWSRKSAAEALFVAQLRQLRVTMSEVFEDLGEFPPAEDKDAMRTYAEKVLARTEKQPKKSR